MSPAKPLAAPPEPADEVAGKRERRKQARPGELLDAALDLFVEKGFAATRSEEVAARAGVSKGTLFLYFPSKEELFKAVVRENVSGRFTEWYEEFESFQGSTPDMVRYCLQVWWDRLGATRASGITKLVISEARNFPELAAFYQQEVINPGNRLIRRILQRGIDRGEFKPLDLDYAVYSIIAPMVHLIMMKHSLAPCAPQDYALDPQRYLQNVADILLGGICAPAAHRTGKR
ncbi:TetR/AcrR family transcriptional regulator [Ramlibacter tataouinensis]|uniref:TetR/AcrR family transcriptional regulator n=1 Tax=Ramlibacter tataouinensis TaxID=94132 RepID=UPI0022F3EF95|nr:TetR/AcrR family transcriptional regulator [Ramlibacter tataouinensis]WBY01313.1 TetR/AcrR family transcriptional regulator [Ramlibacter tataouinensis]